MSGKFVLIVEWVKDEIVVGDSLYFSVEDEDGKYSLIIFDVGLEDLGIYKCVVSNSVGILIRIFNVNIEGENILLILVF